MRQIQGPLPLRAWCSAKAERPDKWSAARSTVASRPHPFHFPHEPWARARDPPRRDRRRWRRATRWAGWRCSSSTARASSRPRGRSGSWRPRASPDAGSPTPSSPSWGHRAAVRTASHSHCPRSAIDRSVGWSADPELDRRAGSCARAGHLFDEMLVIMRVRVGLARVRHHLRAMVSCESVVLCCLLFLTNGRLSWSLVKPCNY